MSTFFKAFQGKAMGKQLFQGCSPLFLALINAQPLKNIGFCIVSLVGQVILNSKLHFAGMPTSGRAALLGHTEAVNEGHYTYDISDIDYKRTMLEKINSQ